MPILYVLAVARLKFSLDVHAAVVLTQLSVLDVVPKTVNPAPSAVTSEGPPNVYVMAVGVGAETFELNVICIEESTDNIVVPAVMVGALDPVIVTAIPGIRPAVVNVPPKTTAALAVDVVIVAPVPLTFVVDTTEASSMFLSSTLNVLLLIVVTVPLTVKFPPMRVVLPLPPMVMVPVDPVRMFAEPVGVAKMLIKPLVTPLSIVTVLFVLADKNDNVEF